MNVWKLKGKARDLRAWMSEVYMEDARQVAQELVLEQTPLEEKVPAGPDRIEADRERTTYRSNEARCGVI